MKLHALADVIGRPYALTLTAGNISDIKAAPALLERAGCMRYVLAGKGYDAQHLRRSLREAGAVPVIPGPRNGGTASVPSATTSSATALATSSRTPSAASPPRYDKLAANFLSSVALAFWL
jgi:transposase